MKTNASNYAFTAILSIMDENNQVHLVTFYSYTFIIAELNIHNKGLLVIFYDW